MYNLKDLEMLGNITESIELLLQRCKDWSFRDLPDEVDKFDAIMYRFIVIGQSSKNLSADCRQLNEKISLLANLINQNLVHTGWNADPQMAWDKIQKDLPQLLTSLSELIKIENDKHQNISKARRL